MSRTPEFEFASDHEIGDLKFKCLKDAPRDPEAYNVISRSYGKVAYVSLVGGLFRVEVPFQGQHALFAAAGPLTDSVFGTREARKHWLEIAASQIVAWLGLSDREREGRIRARTLEVQLRLAEVLKRMPSHEPNAVLGAISKLQTDIAIEEYKASTVSAATQVSAPHDTYFYTRKEVEALFSAIFKKPVQVEYTGTATMHANKFSLKQLMVHVPNG